MREGSSAFRILTENTTITRPLGRLMPTWKNNIKILEMSVTVRSWVESTQDRNY
jgi:hypothetical protein